MRQLFLIGLLSFVAVSCSHVTRRDQRAEEPKEELAWNEDARVVSAELNQPGGVDFQGVVNFEQMPNSVIVTFRIEGLVAKKWYQIVLHKRQSCDEIEKPSGLVLYRMRADGKGVAQNTFGTDEFKVRTPSPLKGSSVGIWKAPKKDPEAATLVACAPLRPGMSPIE